MPGRRLRPAHPVPAPHEDCAAASGANSRRWAHNRIMSRSRLDPLAVTVVAIVLVVAGIYVGIMGAQGDTPAGWFLAALLLGAVAAGYGANRARPRRGAALALAAAVLAAMGWLALLSIGFPLLVAAALCLVAAVRQGRRGADAEGHPGVLGTP